MSETLKSLLKLIDEKQGKNVVAIDTTKISSFSDYVVIATTTSTVHTRSLSKYIIDFLCENNQDTFLSKRSINLDNTWVLLDGGNVVVNLFQEETREFYNLEKLYFNGEVVYGL